MASFPLVTLDLVRRIAYDYGNDRIRIFQEVAGNPYEIEFHTFGQVQATLSKNPGYNFVLGVEDDVDENLIGDLIALHKARDCSLVIQIPSVFISVRLAQSLFKRGLYMSGGQPVLYADPLFTIQQPETSNGVTVEEVRDEEQMALFLSILREGSPIPGDRPEILHGMNWIGRPGWHPYVARIDGEPAANGMLYVRNGTGYLTMAATLPAFRRRGCQAALLQHRIAAAHSLGCDLVTGSARFDSTSQHNLERAGLRIAYVLTNWLSLPS